MALGFFSDGRFLVTDSIYMLVMGLLRSPISSWVSFGKLYFSKNLSISSKLSILLAELLVVVSYDPLYFSVVCCDLSIFVSNFVNLVLLSLFLNESC